ncbi:MAG: 3-dehydroquinate synthase [Clostridiales bacterium]
MINLNVSLGDRSYPIYISKGYDEINVVLNNISKTKIVMITDENIDKCQYKYFAKSLIKYGYDINKFVIKTGEESKNLDTIRSIYEYLIELKCDRKSILIALGGGVVGDITGFVAATYLRGINFVQVPTTLLAQADSSVGGKVGVDFNGSKNIIGAFYQPKAVYINVSSLKTLPERDYIAGLAETIKHGIVYDKDFFEYLDLNLDKVLERREDVLQYVAKMNCSIKGSVIEQDEKENGLRAILNFGHTIGHAIESVMDFEMPHGECISLGFISACKIAEDLNLIDKEVTIKIENILKRAKLPVKIKKLDVDIVYNQLHYDKKIKNKKLMFILPERLGKVIQIHVENEEIIKNSIRFLMRE